MGPTLLGNRRDHPQGLPARVRSLDVTIHVDAWIDGRPAVEVLQRLVGPPAVSGIRQVALAWYP